MKGDLSIAQALEVAESVTDANIVLRNRVAIEALVG